MFFYTKCDTKETLDSIKKILMYGSSMACFIICVVSINYILRLSNLFFITKVSVLAAVLNKIVGLLDYFIVPLLIIIMCVYIPLFFIYYNNTFRNCIKCNK